MKSKDEEFSKSQFGKFIQKIPPNVTIQWEEVEQQNEPPDYYLYLDGNKFAVEVTILMENLQVGNIKLPHVAIIASLWNLVDEVERIAINGNYLHGAYAVRFSKPITEFNLVKEQIRQGLLTYIRSTQTMRNAPEQTVFENSRQKCTIKKLHNQSTYIGKIGPTDSKWEGEVLAEICNLLAERINNKEYKLRNVTSPKILLLYDLYHFARPQMYRPCLSTLKSAITFHTIFVAQSNEQGFVLFSINQEWLEEIA